MKVCEPGRCWAFHPRFHAAVSFTKKASRPTALPLVAGVNVEAVNEHAVGGEDIDRPALDERCGASHNKTCFTLAHSAAIVSGARWM